MRIERTIRELDYHPNAAARSLKSSLTRRIGLVPVVSPEANRGIVPGDDAFLELLAGLNTVAAENGFDILISAATDEKQELKTYQRVVGESLVDGLVVMGLHSRDQRISFLQSKGFPFVAYGRSEKRCQYPYVDVDGGAGIEKALDYLVELGHRRIAYIAPPAKLVCSSQRWAGFARGMERNGLPIDERLVVEGGFSQASGVEAVEALFGAGARPSAILAPNDICAFGVMQALKRRGLSVGSDVSVIGFDDITMAGHWSPSLTTLSQSFRKIGFYLMQSLIEILSDKSALPQLMLDPNLVVRESSGRAIE